MDRGFVPNQGSDGLAFRPNLRLGVVADGISASNGDGMTDTRRLLRNFYMLTDFREAFFRLFGPKSKSTMTAIQFPEHYGEEARILSAGDCEAFCLRGQEITQISGRVHSVYGMIAEALDAETRQALDIKTHNVDVEGIKRNAHKVIQALEKQRWLIHEHVVDLMINAITGYLKEDTPDWIAYKLESFLGFCLTEPRYEAERVLGDGTRWRVEKGDRFVLCTDGVTDCLTEAEMRWILNTEPHNQGAAEALVVAAHERRLKTDDRAVLIVGT